MTTDDIIKMDVQKALRHEIGHYVLARHFDIPCYIEMEYDPTKNIYETKQVSARLRMVSEWTNLTPYQCSIIGWGGTIAENCNPAIDNIDDYELLKEWYEELSETDIAFIERFPNRNRTFRAAWQLLARYANDIDAIFKEKLPQVDNK